MKRNFPAIGLAVLIAPAAALAAPAFKDCPLLGPMPDYAASAPPQYRHWYTISIPTKAANGDDTTINPLGRVCQQDYGEAEGKTVGSILEITENYKQALSQVGAEIKVDQPGNLTAHLARDGKETWFHVSATRDDGYEITEIETAPFHYTLLPPSGNDYPLLGHMPGFTANPPDKKRFAEHAFPTKDGDVTVRGAYYNVTYQVPDTAPGQARVTEREVIENYRQALTEAHAQFLRIDPDESQPTNITARFEQNGKIIWIFVDPASVTALEEKPFEFTLKPPSVDELKDKLDKEGHIALYINFDFDKATLKPDAAPVVGQIVALLQRNPELKVAINGNTDAIGGHDYNVKLSQNRAASVVAAIVTAGIDKARLSSEGFGPDKPIAPNDTDEGRAKNRRVELVKAP